MTTHPTPPDQTEGKNGEMPDERREAINLANRLLDEPNCDPDDDLRVLSRQLLRAIERADLASPAQPAERDQTAAAQEREALPTLESVFIADARRKYPGLFDIQRAYVQGCFAGRNTIPALSTAQREPCMDVDHICNELAKRVEKRHGTTIMYDAADILRGLLTGRTEAKAEGDMVLVPQGYVDAVAELVEVAQLRGDCDLPDPADDPQLWTARMQEAWDEIIRQNDAVISAAPPVQQGHAQITEDERAARIQALKAARQRVGG